MTTIATTNEPDEWRECADCQQPFCLTAGEKGFFLGKGLKLPRRCRACRQARSEREGAEQVRAFDR